MKSIANTHNLISRRFFKQKHYNEEKTRQKLIAKKATFSNSNNCFT